MIVVVGAGTMGRGITAAALAAGFDTTLVDVDEAALERGHALAERYAYDQLERLTLSGDLEDAVEDAEKVIEAAPELLELKREIFARVDAAAPAGALLASNTSTIAISRLAAVCERPERVVGLHFFNPVHRMALVEVVAGERTSGQTMTRARDFALRLGKEPIVVKDVPGFVANRLGLILGNEAMRLVQDGVASAADVDRAAKLGFGHPMGPLELADLVGLDARLNNLRSLYAQTGREEYRPPAILEQRVAQGRLGRKSGGGFHDYVGNRRANS